MPNRKGSWECRIYRRTGRPCVECGMIIRSLSLRPSKRATYFCPKCQERSR